MSKVVAYKIRNRVTGLWMRSTWSWTKFGRIWGRKCDISNAVNCGKTWLKKHENLDDLEVVVLEEKEVIHFKDFFTEDLKPR